MGEVHDIPLVAGHQWQLNSVLIQTRAKVSGRVEAGFKKLNFVELGISQGGLLDQCIRDSAAPMQKSDAYCITRTLIAIAPHQENFRRILSSPPKMLLVSDISSLLMIIDAHFATQKIKSRASTAEIFRNFILNCQMPLHNGALTRQTPYKSTLKVPARTPRKDITSHGERNLNARSISPVDAISIQNENDFKKFAQRHYDNTLKPIIQTCVDVLELHAEVQRILKAAQSRPLPSRLTKKNLAMLNSRKKHIDLRVAAKQNSEEQLVIALAVIRKLKLFKYAPVAVILPPKGIRQIDKLTGKATTRSRFGVLLSNYYLSRHVVLACYVILLFHTRWNSDTLISVTAAKIRRTAHGFEITGVKHKTNSNQNIEIAIDDETTCIEETSAVRAIELLLWHNAQVDSLASRRHPSLFVSMSHSYHKKLEFNVFLCSKYFREFTSWWDLPNFTASDIRPNSERHHFLKKGMHIEDSRVSLNHKQSSTSAHYVAGQISLIINEAMIIRYQAMLGQAIVFRTIGTPIHPYYSPKQKETIQNLLLPPTRFSSNTADYLVDKWLADSEFTFEIGPAEVEQCVRQKRYYLTTMNSLRKANPTRFSRSELPRILVCLALYGLIKDSPYQRQLELLEEELYAH